MGADRIRWVWASQQAVCRGFGGKPVGYIWLVLFLWDAFGDGLETKREPAARVGYVPTRGRRPGAQAPVLLRSRREKDMADEIILELDHVTGESNLFFFGKTEI